MEQQSRHSFGNSENLPDFSTDSFPNGDSIEHSAECALVPFQNHVDILPYRSYSDSYEHDVNREAYLDVIDVNRNINENILDDSLLPFEQYGNDYDDYEHVPRENFHYDYLDNMDQFEWHKEDFYNGANFETIYFNGFSTYATTNYTSYIHGGTMYFVPLQDTLNDLHTGHTTHSLSGFTDTGTQHTDIAQFKAELNSTLTENSCFDSTNIESRKEATEPEAPRTAAINAESRLEATNTEFKPITSIANSQCIGSETNYEGSLNSNNLNDGQNSGDRNSNEHVDGKDGKDVSGHVENGSNGSQIYRNVSSNANRRNKRANSRKVSVNNCRRGDSSGICLKNFDSRRNGQSSSDYNSLNTKHLNDPNGNGLENADSQQGNRRNSANSDDARSRDIPSSEGCNRTCYVHCDIVWNGESRENCKTYGVSSELDKSNCSYSAAVKRRLNSAP